MLFNRQSQLDENSRKQYINDKIIPYIPKPLKSHYIERIFAVVDMYAGIDAEVISIIEDAVEKDHCTEKCINLEKVLGILMGNSAEKKAIILKECHKELNINHLAPKREIDAVPAICHTKSIKDKDKKDIKENVAKPVITKNQIYQILDHCA